MKTPKATVVRFGFLLFLVTLALRVSATTPPPISFVQVPTGTSSNLFQIAIGNGVYVAAGAESLVSTNCTNWQKLPIAAASVIFAHNHFVMLDLSQQRTHASSNGFDWTSYDLGTNKFAYIVAGGPGFVGKGTLLGFSPDGVTWTTQPFPIPERFKNAANYYVVWSGGLLYGNGRFIALGRIRQSSYLGDTYAISMDGQHWTATDIPNPQADTDLKSLVGFLYGYFYSATTSPAWWSADGLNWTYFIASDPLWKSMSLVGGRIVRIPTATTISIAHGAGFDTYNSGVTNALNTPVFDGKEYLFPGSAGLILKTQGAPMLASLKINSIANGQIDMTATGNPGWSYGVVQFPATGDYPNSFPTNTIINFTLEAASTNFAIPIPEGAAYFRLIER